MGSFTSFFTRCFQGAQEDSAESCGASNVRLYTYKELCRATEDFSLVNKIGEGGFGSVYKGQLKNGKVAAIKVLSAKSRQGPREFLTEIQVISKIKHENLVQLYGCCVEEPHRIVVYNFLEKNSLQETLLSGGLNTESFPWRTRYNIAIGVAKGLAFLHEEVSPCIIHRDIKASNILLDNDFSPRISDFGLAKVIPDNKTHVSTRVAGTVGYLAPEYALRGQLTRKADIYSFGVLLIEIVSGKCNKNNRLPAGEKYLLERTWKLYEQNELLTMVDETMSVFDADEASRLMKVALLCTQESPKQRPPMSTVVKMLTGVKKLDGHKITRPGLISDLMDLKVKDDSTGKTSQKNSGQKSKRTSSSSSSSGLGTSTMSWANAS